MNGADSLCDTLLANGVTVCFANPGTSEMHFVSALDRKPEMRCILGLFEGVVTGAADGYARMTQRPAATLLHLGPGLANGLANMHNAKRAGTPMVNIVGDHASYHLAYDAPLTSDIESLARPMSHWVHRVQGAGSVAEDASEAIRIARSAGGKIATLILPADAAWSELPAQQRCAVPVPLESLEPPDSDAIRAAATAIREDGAGALLLLGGPALRGRALDIAGQIARTTGCRLMSETSSQRIERGHGRTPVSRLPYPVDQAVIALGNARTLLLVGTHRPVAFFAYPGKPSDLTAPGCRCISLATRQQDALSTLQLLAQELGISEQSPPLRASPRPGAAPVTGPLTGSAVCRILASLLPENAIVCDEGVTQGRDFPAASLSSSPHDYLQLTGGAIGIGLPMAVGAAIACPGRKVISLQADGSAMYTLQALWTQARESLNCLTVILSNRSYAILHGEMANVGGSLIPNGNAQRMLDLDKPELDWVAMARGMGVPGARVDRVEDFIMQLRAGLGESGPYLIEAVI